MRSVISINLRETLDEEKSVADNVGGGRTYIKLNGKDRHIVGYLKGFLFSPKRSMTPVKALSGGERNRIILAKLFTQAANLLVLDEPTNDLDMETLEVLEQRLTDYSGTLIIVSHDREFMDNVVTSTIVFEENGGSARVCRWIFRLAAPGQSACRKLTIQILSPAFDSTPAESQPKQKSKKLSYNEQRELDPIATANQRTGNKSWHAIGENLLQRFLLTGSR